MDFNTYQDKATQTATYPQRGGNLVYPALGLAGEAGEVIEKIKKLSRNKDILVPGYYHTTQEWRDELAKELGDVLWYIAALATELDFRLDEIALRNIEKLFDRQARGVIKSEGDNR